MKPGISNEPMVWGPFSGGGMLAATLAPIHIILFGLLIPLGAIAVSYEGMESLVANPITRLYLLALIGGCFFHWAHRFRYIVIDLGVPHKLAPIIAALSYGSATILSGWGAFVLFGPVAHT